jgi:hypothetical protein
MPAEALALLAALVLDDGRRWGEAATDWQLADAMAVCDPFGPRRHFQVRPRGASKTTDAAAAALALLVTEAPPRSRSHAYAVDAEQAAILLDALAGFATRTPGLSGTLRLEAGRATVLRSGATLQVEASDAASAFGRAPMAHGHRRALVLAPDPEPCAVVGRGRVGASQAG